MSDYPTEPPHTSAEPTPTEQSFEVSSGGGRGKFLGLVFGLAVGVFAGKFVWKPPVTVTQFDAVKAKGAAAEKSLAAIKGQLEDLQKSVAGKICFADERDPEFERARKMVLATMGGNDIVGLRDRELQKTAAFLQTNNRLWRGNEDKASDRFDGAVADGGRGQYKGTWTLQFPGEEKRELTFDLDLNGFQPNDDPNVVRYRDVEGTFKSTIEFRYRLLGTNSDKQRLHLIVDNAFKGPQKQHPYFGFRFPADLKSKQRARGKVLGLTPDRRWQVVGEYTIQRK